MAKKNFAALLQVAMVAMVVCVTSCTDSFHEETKAVTAIVGENPVPYYSMERVSCDPKPESFKHTFESGITVKHQGVDAVYSKTLYSQCSINCTDDTINIMDGDAIAQTGVSISRAFVNGIENDRVEITLSCGQSLILLYSAEHSAAEKYEWTDVAGAKREALYQYGHDSLLIARFLRAEFTPLTKGNDVPGKYVKSVMLVTFYVETVTVPVRGDGKLRDQHTDLLEVKAVAKIWDENSSTATLGNYGTIVINETTEKDSVEIIHRWENGQEITTVYPQVRYRGVENIGRQTAIVSSYDYKVVGHSFVEDTLTEVAVRSDANWTTFRRNGSFTKLVSVHGTEKKIQYPEFRERSVFRYKNIVVPFGYGTWNIVNESDDFTPNPASDMAGHSELDYTNKISANYRGYSHSLSEIVSWYCKTNDIVGYDTINAKRIDFVTHTFVSFDKYAVYADGSKKFVEHKEATIPIEVTPLSNWVHNTDKLGTYVSGDFTKSQLSKTKKTVETFFHYNSYEYQFTNQVNGLENKFKVKVPNEIYYEDADLKFSYENTQLSVAKNNDGVRKSSSESGVDTYAYTCTAGVSFGASQEVILPGTIKVDARSHEHGKVKETIFTTVRSENYSSYKSCAVIVFEDGYRSIGLCGNTENTFNFTMSSRKDGINSAVYADGRWMPATVVDDTNCMRWRDENGVKRDVVEYLSATADPWNNGHNTSRDVRREGKISADGYSVTFYLNGSAGQTLNF